MTLTPLAESLKQPLEQTLAHAKQLRSGHEKFDPTMAKRDFHIGMSDHIAYVLLPKLIPYLNNHAPDISIIQHPVNYMHGSDAFDTQSLDLVIGDFSAASDRLKSQALFSDNAILVMDRHHPLCKKRRIQTKDLLAFPHIVVSLEGLPRKNFIVDYLSAQLGEIKVALYSPHTLASLYAVAGSNCIAHSVSHLAAPLLKTHQLCARKAPYAKQFPSYRAKQYWPLNLHDDPGHRWLRATIKELCKNKRPER